MPEIVTCSGEYFMLKRSIKYVVMFLIYAEMNLTASGSCSVADIGIKNVETSGFCYRSRSYM
jgi:hypothetical protein